MVVDFPKRVLSPKYTYQTRSPTPLRLVTESCRTTECAYQKSDERGSSEPQPPTERGKFRKTRDLQRGRSTYAELGTASATGMAVEGADNELGPATMAGCASFGDYDSFGNRHGRPPKIVLCLIGCFCHKEVCFRSFSDRKRITKARYCKDDSYKQAEGEGGGWEGKIYVVQP